MSEISNSRLPSQIVNDAVFGFITIEPYIAAIIDTVEFQRLRTIWQLGVAPFVYPTADHSRFGHSIGTYHLASKLVRKLQKQLKDEELAMVITDRDVMCVEIAALCHDLGHGPFSHFWDNVLLPEILGKGKFQKHEEHFEYIWKMKILDKVNRKLSPNELNDEDENLIFALIEGKEIYNKELICGIVSNSKSGMDVDKWDYLARDSVNLGHSTTYFNIDIDRMIHYARAIEDSDGKWRIAFRESEGLNMLRVFQLRHYLHKTMCQHRSVAIIEQMMLDGFKQYFIDLKDPDIKLKIGTPDWILTNDQSIFWSNTTMIKEFRRIVERDLYEVVFEAVINKTEYDITNELIKYLKDESIETTIDQINGKEILKDYRIRYCKFNLSSVKTNPMLSIPFYKTSNLESIFEYEADNLPSNLNYDVDETKITILSIRSKFDDKIDHKIDHNRIQGCLETYFERKNKDNLKKQEFLKRKYPTQDSFSAKRKNKWKYERV